jgi:hypothetical protein
MDILLDLAYLFLSIYVCTKYVLCVGYQLLTHKCWQVSRFGVSNPGFRILWSGIEIAFFQWNWHENSTMELTFLLDHEQKREFWKMNLNTCLNSLDKIKWNAFENLVNRIKFTSNWSILNICQTLYLCIFFINFNLMQIFVLQECRLHISFLIS